MDLQTLRFFVASADAGSFSAAAENLHYAQSNLSNRIKQLEEELGEPLFYRHKRGVSLTAKGKVFYDYSIPDAGWQSRPLRVTALRSGTGPRRGKRKK